MDIFNNYIIAINAAVKYPFCLLDKEAMPNI